jgi:AraC family L-rhamnose operon regulatory protein RhaS
MTLFSNDEFLESKDFPFFVGPYRIHEDAPVLPHAHEFVELAYIAEGAGNHTYNGENSSVSAGDVFIIEPGVVHSYNVDKQFSLLVYNILFVPSLLRTEIEALSAVDSFMDFFYVEPFLRSTARFQPHLKLQLDDQMEIRSLLDRIHLEFRAKQSGYRILTKTRLIELFVFLSRCYARLQAPVKSFRTDDYMLHHLCEFIHRHYAEPLNLHQVSRMCGLSPSAFSVKFKQHTGKTFIEYRNELRIQAAMERLRETDDKISQISQDVGYDDLSFFNKLFKQTVGVSPGDFRKLSNRIG